MTNPTIEREDKFCAHNYHPLPVVLVRGNGPYVWDDAGRRYVDMMSAYSAVSHGHAHPRLVKALVRQAADLNIVSRAFHTDKLAPFLERICELTGQDVALPMNTGAEAVETAIKAARKWAYEVKGVADNQAEIIACQGNFHGRTIAIVGLSSEEQYRDGFGPFPAGLEIIEYGNTDALDASIPALEADYELLASHADENWLYFTLGIPNPMGQRYPLRDYSSSICPWAHPDHFKGVRCQYAGGDGSCTGTLEDCNTKGNAVYWGGEIGMDPVGMSI